MQRSAYLPLTLLLLFLSCSRQPVDFQAALFLYQQNNLEEALPLFEDLAAQDPANPRDVVYLAEVYRRFGQKQKAIETARRVLGMEPCNAFAHTIIGEASNPVTGMWEGADSETTWVHLLQAAACDPKDGNPWLTIWGESVHRGDRGTMTMAAEKMIETGFFPKALLSYTEWVLTSLPENAILITNGDMDTYPAVALQEVEELRRDVVVVNRGMVGEPWCSRYLRDVKGVPMPFSDAELENLTARTGDGVVVETPSDDIIRGWITMWKEGKIRNPVTFAMTVPREYAERFDEPLQYAGAYRIVRSEETDQPDVDAIRAGLEGFTAEDFFGPWVSEQDRSPVRRVGTKNIVQNVTYAALTLADGLRREGRTDEAIPWLTFAEDLDMRSDLGPVYRDRIAELKRTLAP